MVFSATLPVKPSVTTTSTSPEKISSPSTKPTVVELAAPRAGAARLHDLCALDVFLADVEQADARASRRRAGPPRSPCPSPRTARGARPCSRGSRRGRACTCGRARARMRETIAGRSMPWIVLEHEARRSPAARRCCRRLTQAAASPDFDQVDRDAHRGVFLRARRPAAARPSRRLRVASTMRQRTPAGAVVEQGA